MSDLHSCLTVKDKACPNRNVYQVKEEESSSMSSNSLKKAFIELSTRKWEEITNSNNPMSLSIVSDFTPNIRSLLRTANNNNDSSTTARTNIGKGDDNDSSSTTISWNISMSQLYLLLSMWYDNVQELPLLFPFSNEFIHQNAIDKNKDTVYPSCGADEWVNKIKDNLLSSIIATSEIAFYVQELNFICSFDPTEYFGSDDDGLPTACIPKEELLQFLCKEKQDIFQSSLKNLCGHVRNENDGLLRLNSNADALEIIDMRKQNNHIHQLPIIVKNSMSVGKNTPCSTELSTNNPIDFNHGLDFGRCTLLETAST